MSALETLAVTYLAELRSQRAQLHTTDELSYRDFLGKFLRGAADALGKTAQFTGEASNPFGRPDYEVTNKASITGYVEAEALGTPLANLTGRAKEQNERFRVNLYNFLLTNHTEFRLYLDGKQVASAKLPDPPEQGVIVIAPSALDELQALLERFLDASTPAATTPDEIAKQLARRARFLRVAAEEMLSGEDSSLHLYWNLYEQTLFEDMGKKKFADVYAQTFTYGLFLAWLNTSSPEFNRETALRSIPRAAVPPIRTLMQFGDIGALPEEFHWIVDGICSDLEAAERTAATRRETAFDDPLVHFYEPFLAAYDPKLRKKAGVYYTPDPVVDFIVRAVDDFLKRKADEGGFNKREGLADSSIRLLDPATGTATFLARAYRQAQETMQQEDAGLWPDRARNHLARHFYGFERLPAAYTLAHIKLRQLLVELGAPLPDTERLPIYLADTMMNRVPAQLNLPGADVLSREIREAARVRDQEEILVVIGNPPYNRNSEHPPQDRQREVTFIGRLIQDYYSVDGQPLGERNPQNLQNDYVKFIRFAQWEIERSGQGIVAFITDNSYLDGVTFRGMRRSLMQTFDYIYLLDLHGNSKKSDDAPDISKDGNVFDITQGVAIAFFIKHEKDSASPKQALIYHADLYGTRQHKYETLRNSDLKSIDWQELSPNAPFYLFRPQEQELRAEYEQGWSVLDIFGTGNKSDQGKRWGLGVITHNDGLLLSYEQEELTRRFVLLASDKSDEEVRDKLDLTEGNYWNTQRERNKVRTYDWKRFLLRYLYRPYDVRWIGYQPNLMEIGRGGASKVIMEHMMKPNLALLTTRQTHDQFDVHCTRHLCAHKSLSAYDGTYVFPLWIYPTEREAAMDIQRQDNLNPVFEKKLVERIGETPAPEDIFHYIYAVFHAPTYRERYAPFLKTDFPRLPLPPDAAAFHALTTLGAKLVALHLLEASELQPTGIAFPVGGDHLVEKRNAAKRYLPPTADGKPGRVCLNATEYFDNVPPEAWEFRVGGYQPASKWLDDRVGRHLTEEDIAHYRRMLAAMRETAALLPAVDAAFLSLIGASM